MVFYFTSAVVQPPILIYMGRDKYENEDLIKYGWPEDVWFHVDKLSSAHVYMRLPKGMAWDAIPQLVLEDCAQLVKENSIEGSKKPSVSVIYTPWANLKKTGDMDTGQVSFHNNKTVKSIFVEKRNTEILNRLRKTKEEKNPDLFAEKTARDQEEIREKKKIHKEHLAEEKRIEEEHRRLAQEKSYDGIFKKAEMTSNRDTVPDEDDFM